MTTAFSGVFIVHDGLIYLILISIWKFYCPDLFLSNNAFDNVLSCVIQDAFTDHMPSTLLTKKPLLDVKFKIEFRYFSDSNINGFLEQISKIVKNFTFSGGNIDIDSVQLSEWFKVIFDKFFPYEYKVVSNKRYIFP